MYSYMNYIFVKKIVLKFETKRSRVKIGFKLIKHKPHFVGTLHYNLHLDTLLVFVHIHLGRVSFKKNFYYNGIYDKEHKL